MSETEESKQPTLVVLQGGGGGGPSAAQVLELCYWLMLIAFVLVLIYTQIKGIGRAEAKRESSGEHS